MSPDSSAAIFRFNHHTQRVRKNRQPIVLDHDDDENRVNPAGFGGIGDSLCSATTQWWVFVDFSSGGLWLPSWHADVLPR
jgi:hypothetical protein